MIILQKTIAERAGVSYATVSRAFTNSAKVKPQTMQKIRNAMQELGITDGDDMLLGKGFVSKAVLVIVSDISNYFYSKVVKGICEGLDPLGYTVVLCHCGLDANRELAAMRRAMENGYSGIIMITVTATEEIIQLLQSSSIPIVLVNRYISALDLETVRIDNYRGGYMAAQYLWERGHRHIAMLTGVKGSGTASDRCRGFSEGLQNYGLSFSSLDMVYGDNTRESGRKFADWLLAQEKPCTAVFVGNDYMAAGMVRRLRDAGRRVPEDYSILCFDDSDLVDEEGLDLTTISCDPVAMGLSAADVFLQRQDNLLGRRFRIVYSPSLKERSSVRNIAEK